MEQQSDNLPRQLVSPPAPPTSIDPGFGGPAASYKREPRGNAVVAWVFIILTIVVSLVIHAVGLRALESGDDKDDPLGVMVMEMQSKYAVGAAQFQGGAGMMYPSLRQTLNNGSVGQRQRFVILAAELQGVAEARYELEELDTLIAEETQKGGDEPFALSEDQARVQAILHALYSVDDEAADAPSIEALSADDRAFLVEQLGWFGRLALAPAGAASEDERRAALQPARTMLILFVGVVAVGGAAGLVGFVCLILLLAFALMGRVRSAVRPGLAHHGLYAEAFAIWMVLILVLQVAAGIAAMAVPSLALVAVLFAFFGSLLAVGWPVVRGASWSAVRIDIGWTLGRKPALEPLVGVGGYMMALPILAVGVALTYVLLLIQQHLTVPGPIFGPSGGPAHPIIEELGGPAWWPKIQVLVLAAVAAPIVEETMFRGVLYRHLRGATARMGLVASIIASTLINSFVFAIIHPQGWVAVPALMSLAIAFSIVREWRGTVIPAMIIHGISNFLVMTMLITALNL